MKHLGRALGTFAVWGGTIGLAHFFNTINLIAGPGAFFLCLGAFILTLVIWTAELK